MLGLLRTLLGGRPPAGPTVELRARDCHCHVLPGVDDGSRDLAESRAMLQLLRAAGVRRVIATPHVFAARFPNEPEALRPRFEALLAAVVDIPIELELGAEHYLDETLSDRIARRRVLSFGPERYVLFEALASGPAPVDLMRTVQALADRGYTPLLAHVERYAWLRGPDRDELAADLRAAGCRFQVNGTADAGHGPRAAALPWLRQHGWIDEVGSDLHRAGPGGMTPHGGAAPRRG